MSITSGEFYTPRNLGSRRGGNVTSLLAGRALKAEAAYAGGWRKGMKGKKGEKPFTAAARRGGWTPSKFRQTSFKRGVAFLSDAQMASRSPYSSTNMTTSTYNMNTRGRNEFFNPDERPAKKEKIHPYTFIANNPIWGST